MISVTKLRAGTTFEENDTPFLVLKYEHTKMGRGKATIKVKVKNLKTEALSEKSFTSGSRVQEIATLKKKLQYLYPGGTLFHFMDPKSFEQFEVSAETIGDQAPFLTEGALVDVLFWNGVVLVIELPPKMNFTVTQADPGIKGNSAANLYKSATLDNGLTIRVPLFIKVGDRVRVDTRNGEYVERAK